MPKYDEIVSNKNIEFNLEKGFYLLKERPKKEAAGYLEKAISEICKNLKYPLNKNNIKDCFDAIQNSLENPAEQEILGIVDKPIAYKIFLTRCIQFMIKSGNESEEILAATEITELQKLHEKQLKELLEELASQKSSQDVGACTAKKWFNSQVELILSTQTAG